MAHSLTARCEDYLRLTATSARNSNGYLIVSQRQGNCYSNQAIYYWFRTLLFRAEIPHGGKGKGPRVHDIRHTFAVHRLKAWAIEGKDMHAMMPILSAYMGHCDLRGTQIYLRLTPDLFQDIAQTMTSFFLDDGKEASQ